MANLTGVTVSGLAGLLYALSNTRSLSTHVANSIVALSAKLVQR